MPPQPIGVETRVDVLLPPGYPAPEKPFAKTYVTTQGDTWDYISLRVFGMKRRDDHLLHHLLIEANYNLRHVCVFPAGIAVKVPDIVAKTVIPLVPWKNVARIQSPTP